MSMGTKDMKTESGNGVNSRNRYQGRADQKKYANKARRVQGKKAAKAD